MCFIRLCDEKWGNKDMLLMKNAEVYNPKYIGKKDVLVCGKKIVLVEDNIPELPIACEIIDAEGMRLIPGLIDQHIHVTGGGGEGSFHTRTPELNLSELIEGGITTVVGLLGTDGITRTVENLYAKVAALNEEGVTAYMLTGAYDYPSPTITGAVDRDITFIKEIVGVKLAISDHRAPNVSVRELIQLASKTRVAGMLSGKPGIVTLHMGDSKKGLSPVFEALDESEIPVTIFRPTHVNRNQWLLKEAYEYLGMGGYIDFTCMPNSDLTPGVCIRNAIEQGLPTGRITISSDGHGSWSNYAEDGSLLEIGVSGVDALWRELVSMVKTQEFTLEEALTYVTGNVAEALGLAGKKGCIAKGADADLLLMDAEMNLQTVIAGGTVFMNGGTIVKKGTYEK